MAKIAEHPAARESAAALRDVGGVRGGSGAMFDRIARRYDLLNRLLSLGIDRRWRRRAVAALGPQAGEQVLDLATGTGDMILEVLRQEPEAKVVGLDPSPGMLAEAADKLAVRHLEGRAELRVGDAQQLPFAEASFDRVAIAFGIRNVPDRDRALAEMARVTRPDGRIAVLELSDPRGGPLARLAGFHVHRIVPWLGAVLSGRAEYRYLERSIALFPPPETFARQMTAAGLEVLAVTPLLLGVACLFVARPAGRPRGVG